MFIYLIFTISNLVSFTFFFKKNIWVISLWLLVLHSKRNVSIKWLEKYVAISNKSSLLSYFLSFFFFRHFFVLRFCFLSHYVRLHKKNFINCLNAWRMRTKGKQTARKTECQTKASTKHILYKCCFLFFIFCFHFAVAILKLNNRICVVNPRYWFSFKTTRLFTLLFFSSMLHGIVNFVCLHNKQIGVKSKKREIDK